MKKYNFPYYTFQDHEVVLLFEHEANAIGLGNPLDYCGDIGAYPINDKVIDYLASGENQPRVTYEDSYIEDIYNLDGPFDAFGEEILIAQVVNAENSQCLSTEWTSVENFEYDEAKRMLLVKTDSYYDWTSHREDFSRWLWEIWLKHEEDARKKVAELRNDWEKVCSNYHTEFLDESVDFDDVFEEELLKLNYLIGD